MCLLVFLFLFLFFAFSVCVCVSICLCVCLRLFFPLCPWLSSLGRTLSLARSPVALPLRPSLPLPLPHATCLFSLPLLHFPHLFSLCPTLFFLSLPLSLSHTHKHFHPPLLPLRRCAEGGDRVGGVRRPGSPVEAAAEAAAMGDGGEGRGGAGEEVVVDDRLLSRPAVSTMAAAGAADSRYEGAKREEGRARRRGRGV